MNGNNNLLLDTNIVLGFLNEVVCDQAIKLRRKIRLKLPDAVIAATAICFNSTLITCDEDLLDNIENLQSINPQHL